MTEGMRVDVREVVAFTKTTEPLFYATRIDWSSVFTREKESLIPIIFAKT